MGYSFTSSQLALPPEVLELLEALELDEEELLELDEELELEEELEDELLDELLLEELELLLLEELLLEVFMPPGLHSMPFNVKPLIGSSAGGLELLALNPKVTVPMLAPIVPFQCEATLDALT